MPGRSKYDPLREWLARRGGSRITASFDEIDGIVGGLPPSARRHQAWWSGSGRAAGTHVQKRSWESAGFTVDVIDLAAEQVTFRRL